MSTFFVVKSEKKEGRKWERKGHHIGNGAKRKKGKYPVSFLCRVMGVNRSGYYKRRQGKMNRYERDREELTRLLQAAHGKQDSHGYHRLARDVSLETGWVFSHNLAHKCCKAAGIHSRARKGRYRRTGEESILFPNQVRGHWNAAAPLQLVVSDIKLERLTGNGPSSWIPSTTRSWLTASHLKGEAISHSTTALNN